MSKICFITGANSGIGKAASIQLASKGCTVLVGARNKERGKKAIAEIKVESKSDKVHLILIDLASQASIKSASEAIIRDYTHIDVLIHNAADFNIAQKEPKQSIDGIDTIWATNHLGPVLLTDLLLDLLKKSKQARILTVASEGLKMFPFLKIDWDDIEFKNRKFTITKAYYQSKIAQVMYTYWLAKELQNTSVTVNCIRVTNVIIDINRYPDISDFMKKIYRMKSRFSITPEQMAETYTYLALDDSLSQVTGKYFNQHNKEVSSNKWSRNLSNIERLIESTQKYLYPEQDGYAQNGKEIDGT